MPEKINKGILGRRNVTSDEIGLALEAGIYSAMREHKRLGVAAATMRDGKVVLVPPEEIVIPEEYLADDEPEAQAKSGD